MNKKEKDLLKFLQDEAALAESDGLMITRGKLMGVAELLESFLRQRDLEVDKRKVEYRMEGK